MSAPQPAPGQPPFFLRTPFLLNYLAGFVAAIAFHGYVHLPGLLRQLGADEATIGFIVGFYPITATLLRPWVGDALDAHGRRVVMLVGTIVTALATLSYLTVTTLGPWLLVIRLLHGAAGAIVFPALFTIAADLSPDARRAQGIAIFGTAGLIAYGVGGILGDELIHLGGYRTWLKGLALLGVGSLCIGVFVKETRPAHDSPAPPTAQARVPMGKRNEPEAGFWRISARPALRPVWIAGFSLAVGFAAQFAFIRNHIATIGHGTVGMFTTAYSVAAITVRLLFSHLPDRVGYKPVALPGLMSMGAGLFFVGLSTAPPWLYTGAALCGVGHGLAFPTLSAMALARVSVRARGTALTAFTALFDLGLLVGAPALGNLVNLTGFRPMYVVAGLFVSLGTALFLFTDRPGRHHSQVRAVQGPPSEVPSPDAPGGPDRHGHDRGERWQTPPARRAKAPL